MIDLHASMITWSRNHHADFISLPEFCQYVYDLYGSVFRVGEALSYSHSTVYVYFKRLGVKMLPKGCRFPPKKLRVLLKLKTEDMTLKEIARATGYVPSYCQKQLRKYKIAYKKIRRAQC